MHSFNTKKSLGQHFLTSTNDINAIINCCGDLTHKNVLEIGPGNGALTNQLVKRSKFLFCIEKDERLKIMMDILKSQNHNFNYILADALTFNLLTLENSPNILISNLPYNIGTQIFLNYLFFCINQKHNFEFFILMFQKEVALRIASKPSDSNYGRLSIISYLFADIQILFDVDKLAFSPPPKVQSCVIKVSPLKKPRYDVNIKILEKLTNLAFLSRRKTLKNNLKSLNIDYVSLNIDPQKRPQDISCEEFCKIANTIKQDF